MITKSKNLIFVLCSWAVYIIKLITMERNPKGTSNILKHKNITALWCIILQMSYPVNFWTLLSEFPHTGLLVSLKVFPLLALPDELKVTENVEPREAWVPHPALRPQHGYTLLLLIGVSHFSSLMYTLNKFFSFLSSYIFF